MSSSHFSGPVVSTAGFSGPIDGAVGGTTPAAGTFTTIDGILGSVTPAAATVTFLRRSVGNALTAAGTTRTDALALTKAVNNVTTAAASTGVTLPASATVGIGGMVYVFNAGANAIQVYGAGSDTIDTVAGSTGVPLTNTKRAVFLCVTANTFISAQLGVISA